MPTITVSKNISITSTTSRIFEVLSNFKHWPAWSPWLIADPEAKLTYSDNAKYYHWQGTRVGSGEMEITREDLNHQIDYNLTFLSPWKSKAKVTFTLSQEGDQTYVTWTMKSSLPFFMFWMKGMMEVYIGLDFERGLKLLKDYLEFGKVQSTLSLEGTKAFEGTKYVGVSSTASFTDVSMTMRHDFGKIAEFAQQNLNITNGLMFSIYHKMDIKNKRFVYTACVGVHNFPTKLPSDFTTGEIAPSSVFVVRHTGPYHHLGNAWSAGSMIERNKEFKKNKKFDPLEIYVNNPMEVDKKDLITDIYFGAK